MSDERIQTQQDKDESSLNDTESGEQNVSRREKRSPRTSKGSGRWKQKQALEELSRLKKEGGKRSEQYQVKEAEAIYEEVDEEKYNEIVQKRREKGRFVVDGDEYDDLGDDTWAFQDREPKDGETQSKTKKGKKTGTSEANKLSAIRKRKMKEVASSVPSQRISDMFLAPTTKSASTVQRQSSENGTSLEGPPSKRQRAASSKGPTNDIDELLNELRADPLAEKTTTPLLFHPSVHSTSNSTVSTPILSQTPNETLSLTISNKQDNEDTSMTERGRNTPVSVASSQASEHSATNSAMVTTSVHSLSTVTAPSLSSVTSVASSQSIITTSSSTSFLSPNKSPSSSLSTSAKTTPTDVLATLSCLNEDDEDNGKYTGPNWWTVNKENPPTATSNTNLSGSTTQSSTLENSLRSPTQALFNRPPPLTEDRELLFYWFDAADDVKNAPGTVYLFGKVWDKNEKNWASCCVAVHGIERTLFIAPRKHPLDERGQPVLDKEVNLDMVEEEFAKVIRRHGKIQWGSRPTKKKYAFEIDEVPKGESEFLEVVYDYSAPELTKSDLSGKTYCHIFGANTSALENFIIQKRLMGPCWLLIQNPQHTSDIPLKSQTHAKVKLLRTWCRYSCFVDKPDRVLIYDIYKQQKEKQEKENTQQQQQQQDNEKEVRRQGKTLSSDNRQKKEEEERMKRIPPLNICSIKVQTILNHETRQHEVVAISFLMKYNVPVDGPTSIDEAKQNLYEYTYLRKLSTAFPHDFAQHLKNIGKGRKIFPQRNESDLLKAAMERLGELDPDIIVGHNFSRIDIDVLLHRMQKFDITTWSKLGRIHNTKMPSFKKGLTKGTETPWIRRKVTAGRLICDTYFAAKEMLRSKDYELSTLARSQLNTIRYELNPTAIVDMYLKSAHLTEMCNVILNDAFLALLLMFKLNVLPLTLQLTQISGNLWYRSLTGARAERIEFRLLHEFYAYNYILPDKVKGAKEPSQKKKNPAYEGGLVLEPKKGLYDKMILLLDFNSLYPSIIQEYNICFTTVVRKRDPADPTKWLPAEPPPKGTPIGILPTVIQGLVERRRNVKETLKRIDVQKDEVKRQQLEIEQQALKLVANSMYGCLGYTKSRFYAMPLAELVTRKGRENLQRTVEIATKMGLEVIYGDTDSIMINTKTKDLKEVKLLGKQLKDKVNQSNIGRNNQKSKLEIEIDGIFETLLLLKKKKYAAKRIIERPDGSIIRMIDKKGLDLVRRDWCDLSKEMGDYVLGIILRGDKSREDAIEAIHDYLRTKAEAIRAGNVPIEKFVITKSLTKAPEAYSDAKNQPHVQVALALKRKNKPVQVGEMIRYVICKLPTNATPSQQGQTEDLNSTTDSSSNLSLAARAFHPDDVKEQNLQIDIEWYMETQILPPILRLVEPIEGTNSAMIAQCLGLDPSRHRPTHSTSVSTDVHLPLAFTAKDQTQYRDCEKFVVSCPQCKKSQEICGIWHSNKDNSSTTGLEFFECLTCSNCRKEFTFAFLANSLTLFMRKCILRYYKSEMICDDPTCSQRSRQLCWKGQRPVCTAKGCNGTMHLEYDAKKLYTQLLYLNNMWDIDKVVKEADSSTRVLLEKNEKRELMSHLKEHVYKTLSQNAYGQVDLQNLFGFFQLS